MAANEKNSDLGVSISGGGVRATLFSLGAMLYLSRCELRDRICLITSVSGGSITNAVIASAGDWASTPADEFEGIVGRTARALANEGSFFVPSKKTALLASIPVVGLAVVSFAGSVLSGHGGGSWSLAVSVFIVFFPIYAAVIITGAGPAVRLLRHGFISATVACHARFGTPGLRDVPEELWFDKLVRDS